MVSQSPLASLYAKRYDNALPIREFQTSSGVERELPTEIVHQILRYAFDDSHQNLQQVKSSTGTKPQSHGDLIALNDALDSFHLATSAGPIEVGSRRKVKLLGDALRLDQPQVFNRLIRKPEFVTEINTLDNQQFSLITKALLAKRWGAVQKLLKLGADVTTPDITGHSAIKWAALLGQSKLVEQMTKEAGKKLSSTEIASLKTLAQEQESCVIHLKQRDSRTRRHFFKFEDIDMQATPAEIEQEFDQTFKKGMAAIAAGKKNWHPIQEHSSSADLSNFGKVIASADENADQRILSAAHALILSGVNVNQNANCLNSPISLVRNSQLLDALLDAGADPNKLPDEGTEPILVRHTKTQNIDNIDNTEDISWAQKLTKSGLDLDQTHGQGSRSELQSALSKATNGDSDALASFLLTKGANPNTGRTQGRPPLNSATMKGHTQVVKDLLQLGATVDNPDSFTKKTALHHAAENGHLEIAENLLKHGADTQATDWKKKTAADYANEKQAEALNHAMELEQAVPPQSTAAALERDNASRFEAIAKKLATMIVER